MSGDSIHGYMFWLVPAEQDRCNEALQQRVQRLAEENRPSPVFQPHVTLLPTAKNTDLARLTTAMRRALVEWRGDSKMTVKLLQPQAGDIFFQAVIMPVETTEGSDLLRLRQLAEDASDIRPPSYFPHLSLMYSKLPKQTLEDIARVTSTDLPSSVDLTELWIVEGKGMVETWSPVVKMRLDGSEI